PAPDADVHSVGQKNFEWIVDKVARLAIERANIAGEPMQGLTWSNFLGGASRAGEKVAAKKGSSTRAALEKKAEEKREVKAVGKKRAAKKEQ
ncbi:MAG TPA: hypothetical protein VLI45_10200, partial [Acidobacteriaceae bacterium]|nr:hypothetical protein [Acidobacteriaceae bacterium]